MRRQLALNYPASKMNTFLARCVKLLDMNVDSQIMQTDREARNKRLAGLLAATHSGDESAFEELYGLCSKQLFGILVRILRVEAVAEEALQESFVKIWQNAGKYVPESGSPMAWLCSVARNHALDLLRRRGLREGQEQADMHEFIQAAPDISKPLDQMSDDAEMLMRCLDEVPADARHCLVGAYCEGYSHEELSQQVDTPVNTIKSWIRRGLISLRKCLDERS